MKNGTSAQAGFAAHAAGSRPHAGLGFCAYPWHVVSTSRAGHVNPNSMVITTDTQLAHRAPYVRADHTRLEAAAGSTRLEERDHCPLVMQLRWRG